MKQESAGMGSLSLSLSIPPPFVTITLLSCNSKNVTNF